MDPLDGFNLVLLLWLAAPVLALLRRPSYLATARGDF